MHKANDSYANALNSQPFGSRAYCYALAKLSGIKVRKARIYAMADKGVVSDAAATKLAATLQRWNGACAYVGTSLQMFGAIWCPATRADLLRLPSTGMDLVHEVREHGDWAALAALATALKATPPQADLWACTSDALESMLMAATGPRHVPYHEQGGARLVRHCIVLYMPTNASQDHWDFARTLLAMCERPGRLGRRGGPLAKRRPLMSAIVVVPFAGGLPPVAEKALDGFLRLEA